MVKHAYLIMAHNEPYILERLLKLIDYEDNDIFLHVDKKANDLDLEEIKTWIKKSNLYFTPRMDIRWATDRQIKCSIMLLDEATKKDHYAYYHFISGVDMPLRSQKEMHKFFDEHQGTEFVHFLSYDPVDESRQERVKYYHVFNNDLRSSSPIKKRISNKLYYTCLKIQKKLKVDRIKGREFRSGANWFSITDDLARFILSKRNEIKKVFSHTYCADELVVQTLIYGTEFYDRLYLKKDDSYEANMRFIDWNRGEPYTFRKEDFDLLMDSGMFFARKFSTKEDKDIVDMIYKKVSAKK